MDVPAYAPNERLMLAAIGYLRKFMENLDNQIERKELRGAVTKMAKLWKMVEDKAMTMKVRGGIREIPESLQQNTDIVREVHDGGGHRRLDAMMAVITARY